MKVYKLKLSVKKLTELTKYKYEKWGYLNYLLSIMSIQNKK